jgi:hypothetical protein
MQTGSGDVVRRHIRTPERGDVPPATPYGLDG